MIKITELQITTPKLISFFMGLLFSVGISAVYMSDIRLPGIPIGFGEVLLFFWVFLVLISKLAHIQSKISLNVFLLGSFWCVIFVILGIGFIYAESTDRVSEHAIHNAISYLFIAVFCVALTAYSPNQMRLEKLAIVSTITFLCFMFIIYVWSFFANDFFGIPLFSSWDYRKFEGLANNPNQAALYVLVFSYLCITWFRQAGPFQKVLSVLGLALCISVGLHSRSDALLIAWIAGLFLYIFIYLLKKTKPWIVANLSKTRLTVVYHSLFLILLVIGFLLRNTIFETLNALFYADVGQGISRKNLTMNGLYAFGESPLVGFGPGAFSGLVDPFDNNEVHITIIDWATQAGLLGALLLVVLVGIAMLNAWKSYKLEFLIGMASLVVFSQFHYILRQPIVWLFLVLALCSQRILYAPKSGRNSD